MQNAQIQKNEEKLERLNMAIAKEKDAFVRKTQEDDLPIDYVSMAESLPKCSEWYKGEKEFYGFYGNRGKAVYEISEMWKHIQAVYEKLQKVQKLKKTIENQKAKLAKADEKGAMLADMPKIFEDLKVAMIECNVERALKQKSLLQKELKETGKEEFLKRHEYKEFSFAAYETENDIRKDTEAHVVKLVEDLFVKTKKICGKVERFSGLKFTKNNSGYPILTGQVIGKDGTASVEPVEAGGYNIQKLHVRYIVKKWC